MVKEKTIEFFCLCFCHLVGVFAVKSVSVMEGDSVVLNSSLTEIQNSDKIFWRFGRNGPLIAKTDGMRNSILDGPDGIFRGRLKLDDKNGSLTIMNITTEHAGVYEADISRSSSSSTHRFNVTVKAATTPAPPSTPASTSASSSNPSGSADPSDPPSNQTVLISAAAAAAGLLLLILAVVIFFICRKHRKTEPQVEPREEEVTYADTTFHKRSEPQTVAKQEEDVVYAGVVTRR